MIKAPPAAPSAVMKNVVESQFTADTASVNLTWSASSEADNYTVVVTPTPPEISTTRVVTNLQLSVGYNIEYSINITAHNCAGSNSTIFPLRIGNHRHNCNRSWIHATFIFLFQVGVV